MGVHFPSSSGWGWLISSVFHIRNYCRKTTYANGYYGAWPAWAVSISVLPLTKPGSAGGLACCSPGWLSNRTELNWAGHARFTVPMHGANASENDALNAIWWPTKEVMIGVVKSYIIHELTPENVVALLPVCVFLGFMNQLLQFVVCFIQRAPFSHIFKV